MIDHVHAGGFPEFVDLRFDEIALAIARLCGDCLALWVIAAWVLSRTGAPRSFVPLALAFLTISMGIITGVITLLGYIGIYSAYTVSVVLIATAALCWAHLTRWRLLEAPRVFRNGARWNRTWRNMPMIPRCILLFVVAVLLLYGATAALSAPLGFDENAYRLPRIAVWLSTGSIRQFDSGNDRMAYMPVGVELVQAWLVGHFPRNFPFIALAGWLGGLLCILSIAGLVRLLRFTTGALVAAVGLFLVLPNVQAQFMTAQTDLYTSGVFAAGVYFLWRSIVTRKWNGLGGCGLGLACAAKGTAYVLGTGLAIATLIYFWRRSASPRLLGLHLVTLLAFWVIFAMPRHLENYWNFGGPFGPSSRVAEHMSLTTPAGAMEKVVQDSFAWAVQNLQPAANPPIFAAVWRRAMEAAVGITSDEAEGVAFDRSRRTSLKRLLGGDRPDADVVGIGTIPMIVFAAGLLVCMFLPGSSTHRAVAAWPMALGLSVSFLVFSLSFSWQLYSYRLLIPWMPFLCVLAAVLWQRGRKWLKVTFVALLLAQATAVGSGYVQGVQYGYSASFDANSQPFATYRARQGAIMWRLSGELKLVAVATEEQFIGGFFRTGAPLGVVPLSPNQATVLFENIRRTGDRSVAVITSQKNVYVQQGDAAFETSRFTVPGIDSLSFLLVRIGRGYEVE